MQFVDKYNPTDEEIRQWASIAGELYPCEDWDLIIATPEREALFLELAATKTCPNRGTFLRVLYLIVGDAVRTSWRTRSVEHVAGMIGAGRGSGAAEVRLWATRSSELVAKPSRFNYTDWCDGGLARRSSDG